MLLVLLVLLAITLKKIPGYDQLNNFRNKTQFTNELKAQVQESLSVSVDMFKPYGSVLDLMMVEIQRQNKWTEVCIVFDKVMLLAGKYQKDFQNKPFWWSLFYLTPERLIGRIKDRLNQEEVTKDFFKTLEYEPSEIKAYNIAMKFVIFYWLVVTLFLPISLLSAWSLNNFLLVILLVVLIIFGIIFLVSLDQFYKYVVKSIVFVKVFHQFFAAFNNQENKRLNFFDNTCDLPRIIEEKWQSNQANKFADILDVDRLEEYQRMQLEAGIRLQTLSAILAMNQAINQDEIERLRMETRLQELQGALRITDEEFHAKEHQRRLAYQSIQSTEQILVAMASFLAYDNIQDHNLQRMMNLMNGMKKKIRKDGDCSDQIFQDFINQITNGTIEL